FAKPYIAKHGSKVGNFFGMIANIDDNVAKLRAFLEEEGLSENTIFIFTTDNGTATGANVFNAAMRGKKGSEYDGGHRVPFFVHWPNGNMNTAMDVEPVTHAVDVLPTLMELCNITSRKERNFDGKSVASLLRGKPDTTIDWDSRILVTDSQRVKDPIMWKSSSVMTSKWRLVNGKELYDIHNDPGQKNDVAKAYPGEVRRLRDFYQGWWEEIEPSFKNATSIYLGHPKANPASLTSHDWITTGSTPWNQGHIRKGVDDEKSTGFWYVNVHSAGTYEIELRRWPKESGQAINSGLEAGAPVPGTRAFRETPGREFLTLDTAHVEIFDKKHSSSFKKDDVNAKFQIKLPAGKTKLTASFTGPNDQSVGAFYAYVTRLDN
ncbi:MAG: sulfatase-like hydrolase/transferase, partial [Mariniblastus sp.]